MHALSKTSRELRYDPIRVAPGLLTAHFDASTVASQLPIARCCARLVVDRHSRAPRDARFVPRGSREPFTTRAPSEKARGSFSRRTFRRARLPSARFKA
jgi:hypothetical protein